jgi:hypothetical protein
MCKQMGLDEKFAETEQTVIHAELEAELAKEEYVKLRSSKKKRTRAMSPRAVGWRSLSPTQKP